MLASRCRFSIPISKVLNISIFMPGVFRFGGMDHRGRNSHGVDEYTMSKRIIPDSE